MHQGNSITEKALQSNGSSAHSSGSLPGGSETRNYNSSSGITSLDKNTHISEFQKKIHTRLQKLNGSHNASQTTHSDLDKTDNALSEEYQSTKSNAFESTRQGRNSSKEELTASNFNSRRNNSPSRINETSHRRKPSSSTSSISGALSSSSTAPSPYQFYKNSSASLLSGSGIFFDNQEEQKRLSTTDTNEINISIHDSTLTSSHFQSIARSEKRNAYKDKLFPDNISRASSSEYMPSEPLQRRSSTIIRNLSPGTDRFSANESQYKENIKVYVRVKPSALDNNSSSQLAPPWFFNERENIVGHTDIGGFQFDRVFGPTEKTTDIFHDAVHDLVNKVFQQYNCTIFAYGTTGSGKTFTMTGDETYGEPGIVQLSVDKIFKRVNILNGPDVEKTAQRFTIKVSYLEIYNERVHDLLTSQPIHVTKNQLLGFTKSNYIKPDLKIRDDPEYGVRIIGLSEHIVESTQEVLSLLSLGNSNRKFNSTDYNIRSSRSHCILLVRLADSMQQTVTTLSLCDLAGSEKASAPSSSFESTRPFNSNTVPTTPKSSSYAPSVCSTSSSLHEKTNKEGSYINKSLLALSTVISRLASSTTDLHVPYRDSKLTRILQPCLNGQSIIANICTIDTWNTHSWAENFNTLRFASRAKNIELAVNKKSKAKRAQSNAFSSGTSEQEYIDMIERLRYQLYEKSGKFENVNTQQSNENWNNKLVLSNIFKQSLCHLPFNEQEIAMRKFDNLLETQKFPFLKSEQKDTNVTKDPTYTETTLQNTNLLHQILREQEAEIIELNRMIQRKDKIISALQTLSESRRISVLSGVSGHKSEYIVQSDTTSSSVDQGVQSANSSFMLD
ncbi:hypothetical protein ACO0QE_002383 [Hanseniaspora vineae]